MSDTSYMPPAVQRTTTGRAAQAHQPLLRMGNHGEGVREIQRLLNRQGARLAEDGDFGPKTDAAVRAFQRANGLAQDGVVGPKTMAKLRDPSARDVPRGGAVNDDRDVGPTRRATGYRNGRPQQLTLVNVGNGQWLAERAGRQFLAMREAARRDGVNLNAISGFRSMEEQQALYRAYRAGRGNLAAPPGYSNHQSGIAMDIQTNGSRSHPAYRWLRDNAGRFGFRNTVASEPWHWEYRG
jgi:hypothetical protein